jgi:hypothetical protein
MRSVLPVRASKTELDAEPQFRPSAKISQITNTVTIMPVTALVGRRNASDVPSLPRIEYSALSF